MSNQLKELLDAARDWPEEDQAELATYAREIEARRTGVYIMTDDERSPSGARNVLRHVYIALYFIAEQPEVSQRTDNPDVRVKMVSRYRYKIFYRISDGCVDILHIRHTSRRPWRTS
ncbi:MAG: hypothetical protein U1C66_00135 [Patescibacteria group bacterium]|nr:hypothetical protein [Patescibacteria group bacterium]